MERIVLKMMYALSIWDFDFFCFTRKMIWLKSRVETEAYVEPVVMKVLFEDRLSPLRTQAAADIYGR